MASCAITSKVGGRLRAGLEMSECVVGSDAMMLPALAGHLHRAAVLVLLGGGRCRSGQRRDGNDCDCDDEVTHGCFSLVDRWFFGRHIDHQSDLCRVLFARICAGSSYSDLTVGSWTSPVAQAEHSFATSWAQPMKSLANGLSVRFLIVMISIAK